jgi:hypothetical protein
MRNKSLIAPSYLCVFLLTLVAAAPACPGPAVVGLVAGSTNASVGGETILPNTTLFSGDRLEVNDGVAVVALGSTSRMVFGRDTVASFLRESDDVTVLLGHGEVSLFHGENAVPVRVKAGDISVVPISGFETLGGVAAGNGVVVVTAKDGRLRVEGNGQAIIVAKGETLTLAARAISPQAARESSVPKPPDVPPPSTRYPAPVEIRETGPGGGSLSASAGGLSHKGTAKADASGVALDAAAPAGSAPVMMPATSDTIGYALNPLASRMGPPSPHAPPKPPKPHEPHEPHGPH